MKTFGDVLESAEELSRDDQETLLSILQRRLAERRRAELVRTVEEARREHKSGRCRAATADAIMKKIRA